MPGVRLLRLCERTVLPPKRVKRDAAGAGRGITAKRRRRLGGKAPISIVRLADRTSGIFRQTCGIVPVFPVIAQILLGIAAYVG